MSHYALVLRQFLVTILGDFQFHSVAKVDILRKYQLNIITQFKCRLGMLPETDKSLAWESS